MIRAEGLHLIKCSSFVKQLTVVGNDTCHGPQSSSSGWDLQCRIVIYTECDVVATRPIVMWCSKVVMSLSRVFQKQFLSTTSNFFSHPFMKWHAHFLKILLQRGGSVRNTPFWRAALFICWPDGFTCSVQEKVKWSSFFVVDEERARLKVWRSLLVNHDDLSGM